MLCHLGHVLVDSVSGLVRACRVTRACGIGGTPEVIAALEMAEVHMKKEQTLVGDRGYDEDRFVSGLRHLGIHAQKTKNFCAERSRHPTKIKGTPPHRC